MNDIKSESWAKIEELKEFLDLIETKIECDFKRAEALDLLSKFQLNYLIKT